MHGHVGHLVPNHLSKENCVSELFLYFFSHKNYGELSHPAIGHHPSPWLPKGALAPALARRIRVTRHSYSSISLTRVTTERNDHRVMQLRPMGGAMVIAMRDMGKIDRKILVAASFPSWPQSAPRARPGRSCAPNTATKGPIFDYASHYHVYGGDVTW